MNEKYNAILYKNYEGSKNHRKMPNSSRAAQFMPFAALTGYDDSIQEASRTTSQKKELTEQEKEVLDYKLKKIIEEKENPIIKVTYFVQDTYKEGGEYITEELEMKKVDEIKHVIYFRNHGTITLEDILEIED